MTTIDDIPTARPASGSSPLRVLVAVIGGVVALIAVTFVIGGGLLVWADATQRDDAGYYTTDTEELTTPTGALVSERLDFGTRVGDNQWTPFDEQEGDLRVRAERTDGDEVFIGVARSADVRDYLRGASYDEVTMGPDWDPDVSYVRRNGEGNRLATPATQDFWFASTSGAGRQTLIWDVEPGGWTIVVMNADASPGISVEANVGANTDLLMPVGIGLLIFGLMLGLGGIALVIGAALWKSAPLYDHPIAPPAVPDAHPVRLDGHLDLHLSRWLWLVKWVLVIPHLVVLTFLWMAVAVATFVAFFAIVFTGRYPRALFDLNVGVMRWTWRVTFYAFAFGSDRYPPFSLAPDPTYGADLTIEYPTRLSRGLPFVKWLLAVPHYIVLGIFGGLGAGAWQWVDQRLGFGAVGVSGVLALAAAVVLLFSGRYPQAMFDVIMGMQRWAYRVYAYTGLLTDDYPPFRFDGGGTDPGSMPEHAPIEPAPAAGGEPATPAPTGGGVS